jgi:hypothetical protein
VSAVEVIMPPLVSPVDEVWHVLLDMGQELAVHWTLVGGQMVLLHALEHDREPSQISQDGDVIADVRSSTDAIASVVAFLTSNGFEPSGISADGLAHRYQRPSKSRPVTFDVMAPEGLGPKADLTTTRPGRTVEVPGGTQALARSERVTLVHEGRRGTVVRPTLLAAMVAKGAATNLAGDPARHLRDLALLCSLVRDPFELRDQMSPKDLQRVRLARRLHDPDAPAWKLLPEQDRVQARSAFDILTST